MTHTKDTREAIAQALEQQDERASVKIMIKDYADGWYELSLGRRPTVGKLLTALEPAPPAGGEWRPWIESMNALMSQLIEALEADDESAVAKIDHEISTQFSNTWFKLKAALTATPAQPTGERMNPTLTPDETALAEEICDAWSVSGLAETAIERRAKVAAKTALAQLRTPAQPTPSGEVDGDVCKLIEGFADNIEELAFRIPAPNEHTPQFVTYANAMRFIAQKRREARTALGGGWRPLTGQAIERLGDTGQPFFASITVTNRQTGATHVETPYLYLAERETEEGAIYYEAAVVGTDDETGWDIDDYEYYMPFDLPPPPQLEGET